MKYQKLNGWPVLKSYSGECLRRIAMPIGGIGTGTISLSGRGGLVDWELMNKPAKKFIPASRPGNHIFCPSFTMQYQTASGKRNAKLLEGPLLPEEYEGHFGCPIPNNGLPRFRECRFNTAYPLAQVEYFDETFAPGVTLQAYNPLIPADSENSGLPVAVMRWLVKNPTEEAMSVSICASMINFAGRPLNEPLPDGAEAINEVFRTNNLRGIQQTVKGLDSTDISNGSFAFCSDSPGEITTATRIVNKIWNTTRLESWDRLLECGDVADSEGEGDLLPMANLCVKIELPPGSRKEINFFLTWHFPNRISWTPHDEPEDVIGNYYCTKYADAMDAAQKLVPQLPELEKTTVQFVESFCSSDLPAAVKEAALFNLSTLRSETCFRSRDGRFYGFEGACDCGGCCHGSCTHVWNYEHSTAFLFGDLAKCMREIEFEHATADNGLMSFRVNLPLKYGQDHGIAAADGQMGCIMKMYREWQLSGDDAWLKQLWPHVRKALEFCWLKGGWDADRDGIMEGCQHNTMDVDYYGPNPQMTFWYLGALRAAEEMASYLGEKNFAAECRRLFDNGSNKANEVMFNGEYYEHIIEAPGANILPGLQLRSLREGERLSPDYQLGSGCLVDQLVGQYTAHILGLGHLTNKENIKKTLQAILKYNYLDNFRNHFNPMRNFVTGDESALLMAGYPEEKRHKVPFPYYAEVMTGFEYTAAIHMIYEGMTEEGIKAISDIRNRYDGAKRNPFDEAECGHHYARAMAAWAAINALTGFQYSAVNGTMEFSAADGTYFWSTGYSWGTVKIKDGQSEISTLYPSE